jgi:PAS domain-containing protein
MTAFSPASSNGSSVRQSTEQSRAEITSDPTFTPAGSLSPRDENPTEGIGLSACLVSTGDEDVSAEQNATRKMSLMKQTVFKYVSASITEILGYTPEELIGKSGYLIFHPDEIPYLREIH